LELSKCETAIPLLMMIGKFLFKIKLDTKLF
jgi:hypothetical protein